MNRKGLFAPLIALVLLVMLIWVWSLMLPDITPLVSNSIAHTQASNDAHADGTEFFLRMFPWAVPIIIILGFLWIMVRG